MKICWMSLVLILSTVCLLGFEKPETYDVDETAVITGTGVNARSGPRTTYRVVTKLKKGTAVKMSQIIGEWAKIHLNGEINGYIHKDFVEQSEEGKGIVRATSVNVRAKPGIHSTVVCTLEDGSVFDIIEITEDNWVQIRYADTRDLYVSREFIKSIEDENGIVTGSKVNVRSGPGTKNRVVTKVYKNMQMMIYKKVEDWYNVRLPDGGDGYIQENYFKPIEVLDQQTNPEQSSATEKVVMENEDNPYTKDNPYIDIEDDKTNSRLKMIENEEVQIRKEVERLMHELKMKK